ncbi:hypothetical protein GM921_16610 [Pedobacter sp. LMG 31464]|uniref:Spi protease inhibitor domain-containing protein n=1 Tax=Pedobacter planticolens TaxID=2679964 RepID=A0A923E2C8_9SPHI|nr:C10 family peptidase [Pedobacter planticolens]MBB2147128.1 hypothetical protein [Pedobacter planticolens]
MNKLISKYLLAIFIISILFSCTKDKPIIENENYIGIEKASSIALTFINRQVSINRKIQSTRDSEVGFSKKVVKNLVSIKAKDNTNAFYIINYEGGGFSIVSADKRTPNILAYSDKNNFRTDTVPSGLDEWLNTTKLKIEEVRDKKIKYTGQDKLDYFAKASNLLPNIAPIDTTCTGYYEEVGPLLQTQWSQGNGYNNLMPSLSCGPAGRAWTGCVATAMAQIIRYHQYPTNWYNYNIMQNTLYSWDYTSAGANEIAAIMQNASASVGASYDCSGTGANLSSVPNSFINTFGYANTAQYLTYGSGSYVTVQNELKASRPIIMGGGTQGNWLIFPIYIKGHAWVVDGFHEGFVCGPEGGYTGASTFLYFHMNWGWGGSYDGWYGLHDFTPGISSYNYENRMIIGIHP